MDGSGPAMMKFDSVKKAYGEIEVFRSVDLDIRSGVHCLVGRNGAGKTTLIRLGLGMTEPDAGVVRLFRENPWSSPRATRRVGVQFEADELLEFLTPMEFLNYCGVLYGLEPGSIRSRAASLLDRFEVPRRGRLCHELSTGNRRQLSLAAALLHEPEFLVLDEPFRGLDPVAVARLCRTLRCFAVGGRGVLLSSHRLELVREIADSAYLVADGAVVPWDTDGCTAFYEETDAVTAEEAKEARVANAS